MWNVRCRGPAGLVTLAGVDPNMSVHAFQQLLSSKAGAPDPALQELLAGFPPKVLQLPEDRENSTVSSLHIQNGDTITVRQLACAAAATIQRPPSGTGANPAAVQPTAALLAAATQHFISSSSSAAVVAGTQPSWATASTASSANQQHQQQQGWAAQPVEYDEDAALAQALAMSVTEQEETVEKARNAEQQEQLRQKELQDQQQQHRQKMQEQHAQQAQAHHQQQQQLQKEQEQQQRDQQQRDQQRAQQQQQQQGLGTVSSQVANGNGHSNHSDQQRGAAVGNGSSAKAPAVAGKNQAAPVSMPLGDGSIVIRRIIDSDNSCLFNAVGYVMEHTRSRAGALRTVIADAVSADPDTYNEGFLEKPNVEYCQWIVQKNKWGGAIELSILAAHYGRQIAAYDIQTMRCDIYGQDAGYSEQVMLLYDGLHYDALAVAAFEGAPETYDITIFEPESTQGKGIAAGAQALVAAAHSARQFTDTNSFTLRCGACQIGLKGEKEAVEHAKSTGHTNFAEY